MLEIAVRRQHRQVATNTKLSQQGVNRPHVHTASTARIADVRGFDVVDSRRPNPVRSGKTFGNERGRLRTADALEEFLQDEAGRTNRLAVVERVTPTCQRRPANQTR